MWPQFSQIYRPFCNTLIDLKHSSIYEVDAAGTGWKRLFLDTGVNAAPIDLSTDGRVLLLEQQSEAGQQSTLWVFSMKGHQRLTNAEASPSSEGVRLFQQ